MIDIQAKAQQVYDQGFCVLESVYDAAEIQEIHRLLDAHWQEIGSSPLKGFGIGIHPLAEKIPAIMPFFNKPLVADVMSAVLRDEVRLVHAGARLSNEDSDSAIGWHNHYSWDPANLPGRDRVERILANVYPDGSNAEVGNLIVLPRGYNQPLDPPSDDRLAVWPGQLVVEVPPGSVVIFETALWHTARRGTKPGIRHLFGGHYQGWSNSTPHPEDNACNGAEVQPYKQENVVLRSLLDATAAA